MNEKTSCINVQIISNRQKSRWKSIIYVDDKTIFSERGSHSQALLRVFFFTFF